MNSRRNTYLPMLVFCSLSVMSLILSGGCCGFDKSENLGSHIDVGFIVKQHFPDFEIIAIKDVQGDAIEYFRKTYPNSDPFLVQGDFDGNGLLDFAAAIYTPGKTDDNSMMAIFLQNDKDSFDFSFISGFTWGFDFIVLEEPGTLLKPYAGGETIKLANDAITIETFEKSAVAFYWDQKKKKFNAIWTED